MKRMVEESDENTRRFTVIERALRLPRACMRLLSPVNYRRKGFALEVSRTPTWEKFTAATQQYHCFLKVYTRDPQNMYAL